MSDIEFPEGIYFNEPREGAPDFVLGTVAIKQKEAVEWLLKTTANEKGYVNLDVKRSKGGKVYMAKNTWTPGGQSVPQPIRDQPPPSAGDFDDDIPFR